MHCLVSYSQAPVCDCDSCTLVYMDKWCASVVVKGCSFSYFKNRHCQACFNVSGGGVRLHFGYVYLPATAARLKCFCSRAGGVMAENRVLDVPLTTALSDCADMCFQRNVVATC